MTIEEIRNRILTDESFVETQLEQFLVYYNLKHTLRWGIDNSQKDQTESVAEHIYGMHILIDYFLPFYPSLNATKVKQLATWHDMAEAVVDDMTTKTKTDDHRKAEFAAEREVTQNAGGHLQGMLADVFSEYESQETAESKFVKAIDKVESIFQMYFLAKTYPVDTGKFKSGDSGWEVEEYRDHRRPYIGQLDVIWEFDKAVTKVIDAAGFFKEWA